MVSRRSILETGPGLGLTFDPAFLRGTRPLTV